VTKNDTALFAAIDLPAAFGLLTRLPMRIDTDAAMARGAASAWAYPVVGAFLGAGAALVAGCAGWIGLGPGITAGIVLAFGIIVTGAMHEDGLADSADGLWGGWERVRRLEIMKDSRIGVYGVCAVGLSLLLRWAALAAILQTEIFWAALIAIGALSRATMVVLMTTLAHARQTGLSRSVGRPGAKTAWTAVGFAVAVVILSGFPGALLVAGLATLVCGVIARNKIGGQTGDILGATQQVSEVVLLISVAATVA